jgi:pyridoxine kinase
MGPPVVILTSLFYGSSDEIVVIASKQLSSPPSSSSPPKRVQFKFTVPRLPRYFTGTGDLFSALILAWSTIHSSNSSGSSEEEEEKEKESFKLICEKSVSTLQLVLRETSAADAAAELAGVRTASLRGGELRLIQSKKHLESPTILYRATPIPSLHPKID